MTVETVREGGGLGVSFCEYGPRVESSTLKYLRLVFNIVGC